MCQGINQKGSTLKARIQNKIGSKYAKKSHLVQGQKSLFLQSTHVAFTYQTIFPKIKWKHITCCINYHPFDKKIVNFKVLFNDNFLTT
jgi:hypothetical protein